MSDEKPSSGREIKIPLKLIIWLVPIVFGSGAAYFIVKEAPKAQAAIEIKVEQHDRRIGEHDTKIAVFERDITHIRGSVDRIERAVARSSWQRRPRPTE